ncbi:hypothetical protein B7767_22350 [Streptomyces sp. 13-12-16]|nr:hypothetical protein B7767_22350 [Streptomyces sp. 13-12-16]
MVRIAVGIRPGTAQTRPRPPEPRPRPPPQQANAMRRPLRSRRAHGGGKPGGRWDTMPPPRHRYAELKAG